MLGCAHQLGLLDVQRGSVFEKGLFIFGRVLLHANAGLCGIANDLVVHIGDIHDVSNFESTLAKEATENVNGDKGAEVADMAVVVHGGTAGIHADLVVL